MTSRIRLIATKEEWQGSEEEQLRVTFSELFGSRSWYSSVSIADDAASLQRLADIFEHPEQMRITAFAHRWQAVPDVCLSDVREMFVEWMDLYGIVVPFSLRAPIEATLRLLLAEQATASHNKLYEAIHQEVDGVATKYIPLFETKDGSLRTLCILRLSQRLLD